MKTNQNLIKFEVGLDLESGARLDSFELMVETYGELNKNRSNGILVCHAFSGNHQAAGIINDKKETGWWDNIIGPGKAVDTNKYFVVCSNNLGGCSGSSGPLSINPASKKPYGKDFPSISVVDWVNSQKLLSDHLGITKWDMVLGGSLGGMQALQWSISFPGSLKKQEYLLLLLNQALRILL
jgi:homoserine O-acetyltransferase